MKKNAHIHLVLETEQLQQFKEKAKEKNVSLSELCRQRLREPSQLNKIEKMLEELLENAKTNTNKSDN